MYQNYYYPAGDRFFPAIPFLTGALVGGAAVGLTRPRPYPYAPYPAYPPVYRPYPFY